jgi:GWxTD domain-containing protein
MGFMLEFTPILFTGDRHYKIEGKILRIKVRENVLLMVSIYNKTVTHGRIILPVGSAQISFFIEENSMKRLLVLALCAGILYPQFVSSQERAPETPAWVYVVGAGATLIAGSVWYYRNFVKSPQPKKKAFKEKNLEEIRYISTPAQRQALKKLNTQEEINAFLQDFWQQLDPTPATPENEVKDEHYRRWAYANEHFADHQEGWKTDRGRVYIIYGHPDDIERFPWTNLGFENGYGSTIKALEAWLYNRPANGSERPNFFSNYNRGMAKFIFADFEGSRRYTQLYSSETGEQSDPRVFVTSL